MSPQRNKDQGQKPVRDAREAARAANQHPAGNARAWRDVVRNGLI